MNILELDSYNLADAVKFNEQLNPRIWQGNKMRPQVRAKLLKIAEDFKQSLGLSDLEVKDITISGSNAGYTYTPNSDIDLHLVVDIPQADSSEVYRELFDAKKFQYNETHNIKIGGYDVELYVENANQPPVSQGMYSVVNDDWIKIPLKKRSTVSDTAVKSKYDVTKHRIESAIKSGNFKRLSNTAAKIKKMRQAGLDKHGELGPENIAYKMLRSQGIIERLYDARVAAKDKELSLRERTIQVKQPFKYGFKTTTDEDVSSNPSGVSPETKMFLSEKPTPDVTEIVSSFVQYCVDKLGIQQDPKIKFKRDPEWSARNKTFGRYHHDSNLLEVSLAGRHVMDILRTVAHELTHQRQHEVSDVPNDAGETGSPWENEANAKAGVLMRDYAQQHPEFFEDGQIDQATPVAEGASGYIPTRAQAKDPRYAMALTVDIKPGQVGKEANKLGLQTDKQGKPALLMKTANLQESLARELALFEEQDLFEIKMTGKNLSKLAGGIPGVKVGLEFEMIVPNVAADEGDGEQEIDYDQDQSVSDIDDACNFFYDGDYNSSREIDRLRESMQEDYTNWVSEKIDDDWYSGAGREYFEEYLEQEDPFDAEEAEEEARNELHTQYGDELDVEEFEKMLFAMVDEKRQAYAEEQWDDQGRNFDRAREQFEQEKWDDYDHSDWLEREGINTMIDVSNQYDITWPYYTSADGDAEEDIKAVALDFMNSMGMDTVAVSESYHGTYEKWNGDSWVNIGRNKPDDCFTIEPDGSLDGDNSSDRGLEFVSYPIPLEDVGNVMSRVQNWAGNYGAYTGKNNKTSMHTNISVPGYDLDKLDYVKAALLLGDEHVLRQFERFGNTYAKPAIEKVRQLVNQKPDQAKELLDKMKSQLNVEASKLIHSGITDKFTSINTKDNRIEYRSPGGDYLSDIADNPKKLQDTINRMVVTMDAAMDPEKYKQEYQKKLYKLLTGQESGREGSTGAKKEMKASDKDLLNIFSRYAAGELPKAALKSFVRQAQLERSVAKGKDVGKMWWRVGLKSNPNYGIEVVGTTRAEAIQAAKDANTDLARYDAASDFTARPVRPYEEQPAQTTQEGNWGIWMNGADRFANQPGTYSRGAEIPLIRFPSEAAADRWIEQQRAERPNMRTDIEVREIEPAAPVNRNTLTPTGPGPWEVFRISDGSSIAELGHTNRMAAETEARAVIDLRREAPELYGVRTATAAQPVPGSTLDLQRQRADAAPATLTRPGQGQQVFTGDWKVLINGEEVYQFGGIGNNQGDANRVGRDWVLQQVRQGTLNPANGADIEVLPVMSEA